VVRDATRVRKCIRSQIVGERHLFSESVELVHIAELQLSNFALTLLSVVDLEKRARSIVGNH
jgi:hypothetical protein